MITKVAILLLMLSALASFIDGGTTTTSTEAVTTTSLATNTPTTNTPAAPTVGQTTAATTKQADTATISIAVGITNATIVTPGNTIHSSNVSTQGNAQFFSTAKQNLVPIKVSIRLTNMDYLPAYADLNSTESKNVSDLICKSFHQLLDTNSTLKDCKVVNLTQGSVIADTQLTIVTPSTSGISIANQVKDLVTKGQQIFLMNLNSTFDGLQTIDESVSPTTIVPGAGKSGTMPFENAHLIGILVGAILVAMKNLVEY